MVLDARGIATFFSVVGRTVGEAELRYYLDIFGKDVPQGASLSLEGGPTQAQYMFATRKWRRALWVARVLRVFPWVQGVGVVNSLGFVTVHEESDIDLLVLCQTGRVWTSRLFVVALLRLLRLRPGEAGKDPVCPSFFVAPDAYDLQAVAIEDDIYLRFWLATLVPVWGEEAFGELFAANQWAVRRSIAPQYVSPGKVVRLCRWLISAFSFGFVERVARAVQLRLLPARIQAKAAQSDHGVVLTDTMLKFHEEDGRAMYRDRWKAAYGTHT